MYLGAHLGIAGGLAEAIGEAERLGAECVQIFSKSPQMWSGPAISAEAAEGFRAAVAAGPVRATAVHHGYLANLASPKAENLARSRTAFRDEIARADLLGVDALIFHPGAHVGSGVPQGLTTLVASLEEAVRASPDSQTRILLENCAGQGTTLGSLEELAEVLARLHEPKRLGVALDTCHLFAAGFDLRSEDGYGAWIDRLRASVGEGAVYAFHLNDAKAPLGSHKDRHENIGQGELGTAGFRRLLADSRWARVPGYLETPLDDRGYARYAEDLAVLRRLREGADRAPGRGAARRRSASGSRPAVATGTARRARKPA